MGFSIGGAFTAGANATSGYLQGQRARQEDEERKAAQQQALDRQASQDAMLNSLRQSEMRWHNAEAERALRPPAAPEAPAQHVQVQPDGSVVLVDTRTGKTTPTGAKGDVQRPPPTNPYSPEALDFDVKKYQRTIGADKAAARSRISGKNPVLTKQKQAFFDHRFNYYTAIHKDPSDPAGLKFLDGDKPDIASAKAEQDVALQYPDEGGAAPPSRGLPSQMQTMHGGDQAVQALGGPPASPTTALAPMPSAPKPATTAAPAPGADPMAKQRSDWDVLASKYGQDMTTQQVGPRP